ncbi:hypothetical protein GGI12_005561 [Dipsacomyces acuminosporus]|nr:hypothetical protein GGI12_005561 [Dipsacomyces acuminosporus]
MASNVVEQYETGKPHLEGTFGNLTDEQALLLQELWKKLLDTFHDDASTLTTPEGPSSTDSPKSNTPTPNGTSATSSRRTSRLRLDRESASPASNEAHKSSSGSSWFGFGSSKAKEEPQSYRQLIGAVADKSSLPPAFASKGDRSIRDAFWGATLCDHPDVLVLRFLRARKWKVDDALKMLLACLKWRLDEDVDWLIWTGESELNYALLQRGIGAIHKTDRIGQPVIYIPVKMNDPKAQPAEQMIEYTIYLMEVARTLLHPPTEKVCLFFDTTDMTLSNMDWDFFKTFLHYLENFYPECLGLVIIYNAPWLFNGLWKLIRPLLDPVVASKVQFVSHKKDLQKFIAPENLLQQFGGSDGFKYSYPLPQPDENKPMFDVQAHTKAEEARREACEAFEAATGKWAGLDSSASDAASAVQERQAAADKLIAASIEQDKYVRARTQYHRSGVIDGGLNIKW